MKRVGKCIRERERYSHTILSVKEGKRQTGPKTLHAGGVFCGRRVSVQMGGVNWWISECKMGLITDLNRGVYMSFKHQAIMHCLSWC